MKQKIIAILFMMCVALAPVIALAAFDPGPPPAPLADISVTGLMNKILDFIWPLFIGFAVIMFIAAGFLFLTSMGDATKVAAARQSLLWAIVGVIVGILAFSIPLIIRNTLGF